MKRRVWLMLSVLAIGVVSFSLNPATTHAATFNQNNIINDVVFDNTLTMSAGQIDAFLNTFPSSCISANNGFQAIDPIGYNPTQGFLYGGNTTAGRVIYDAANAYGLNPQVLLSTIQKEEGIVDGSGPYGCSALALAASAGYGCPDGGASYNYSGVNLYTLNGVTVTSVNGTCVNTSLKVGFTQQIIRAAWLLKFGEQRSEGNINWAVIKGSWDNSDDPQSCYSGPMTQGTWVVCPSGAAAYYDGTTTIDGTTVQLDDGATAALYWYTPHFSGNQDFFNIFNNWFGSPYTSNIAYQWAIDSQGTYADSGYTQAFTNGISIAPGQKAYLKVNARNFGYTDWSQSVVHLGTPEASSIFADSSWLSPNRIQMQQTSVLPGSDATYQFSITAPTTPGTYTQKFNVVADGVTWLNNPGLYFTIDVVAPRSATNTQNTGLVAGQSITPSQHLLSPDTQSSLSLLPNGDVILEGDYKTLWSNNVTNATPQELVMQGDGNLVEYDTIGHALWASNTNGNAGATLALQTDGNLVVLSSTNTVLWSTNTTSVPNHLNKVDRVVPTGVVYPGQSLDTADMRYQLILQGDGNLVLYDTIAGRVLWATNTNGQSVAYLTMQGDGNLVLYDTSGRPIWASGTNGDAGVNLVLQPDGTLTLVSGGGTAMPLLQTLHIGQYITTTDQHYQLILQGDGNLVLYDTITGQSIWASNTMGMSVAYFAMQGDGNMVLYNTSGHPVWSSNTSGTGPLTHLYLQSDGNLVIYNGQHQAIWSTGTSGA